MFRLLGAPVPPPATFDACHGCDVCALSCPVWQQTRDMRLTPKGRAKAIQGGAGAEDLVESLSACLMCGSCVPACPERIDLVGMTLTLRADLARAGRSPLAPLTEGLAVPPALSARPAVAGKTVLLAEPRLLADLPALSSAILRLGGPSHVVVPDDTGADIAWSIEAGLTPDPARIAGFLESLSGALRVILCEGFLIGFLRERLPGTPIRGIGEACLAVPAVREALRTSDYYVLDTRAYHADRERLVRVYDTLRRETGCALNLDLQRLAIPTGARAVPSRHGAGPVRVQEQVRWMLEGWHPRRIVVENLEDGEAMRAHTGLPVVHVAGVGTSG
ncbi:MAG: (Fe-S)-binding protein [Candidatus Brocadiae bacterium]|nr:(Fe-S)-binding protein [Candidatus Brocadiia bacterium]